MLIIKASYSLNLESLLTLVLKEQISNARKKSLPQNGLQKGGPFMERILHHDRHDHHDHHRHRHHASSSCPFRCEGNRALEGILTTHFMPVKHEYDCCFCDHLALQTASPSFAEYRQTHCTDTTRNRLQKDAQVFHQCFLLAQWLTLPFVAIVTTRNNIRKARPERFVLKITLKSWKRLGLRVLCSERPTHRRMFPICLSSSSFQSWLINCRCLIKPVHCIWLHVMANNFSLLLSVFILSLFFKLKINNLLISWSCQCIGLAVLQLTTISEQASAS